MIRLCIAIFIAILLFPLPMQASPEFEHNFEAYLTNEDLRTQFNEPLYKKDLMSFYEARNYQPVWFNERNRKIEDINKIKDSIFENAYINGLETSDYTFDAILKTKVENSSKDWFFEREWMLTNAIMHFINDIRTGRIKPHEVDSLMFTMPEHRALSERTVGLLDAWNKSSYIESLVPQQREYKQLREKLAVYRDIAEEGGWPEISFSGKTIIKPGDVHEALPLIRARLENDYHQYDGKLPKGIWIDEARLPKTKIVKGNDGDVEAQGDQKKAQNPDLVYDDELALKLAEFQYFHGQKADGVIGPETIEVLNKSVEDQIEKIIFSMERWRWLPDNLGKKHVRVNIAAFHVRAIENDRDEFVMPIIVGEVAHQTPAFNSVITDVKIHPDWTSPTSIADRYVIPKIQKNPSVVYDLGYQAIDKNTGQVVPWESLSPSQLNSANYTFRQKPGKSNALGMARFSIKNDYAIFMHGTPSMNLFDKNDRTFSSGCIRLEDPFEMAYFLLRDQGMTRAKLRELYDLDGNEHPETNVIDLEQDVPVYLMYMTAWVDQKGNIHFADDVYGRDETLKNALITLN